MWTKNTAAGYVFCARTRYKKPQLYNGSSQCPLVSRQRYLKKSKRSSRIPRGANPKETVACKDPDLSRSRNAAPLKRSVKHRCLWVSSAAMPFVHWISPPEPTFSGLGSSAHSAETGKYSGRITAKVDGAVFGFGLFDHAFDLDLDRDLDLDPYPRPRQIDRRQCPIPVEEGLFSGSLSNFRCANMLPPVSL